LELILHNDDKAHEFNVTLNELKNLPVPPNQVDIKKEPQLRQNLILAHQIQKSLAKGMLKDLKQTADCLNISHIKIYLIMNMLMLAPSIQEDILLSDNANIPLIPEYKIHEICREIIWEKQKEMWQEIKAELAYESLPGRTILAAL
jgi:hypothetical protein